MLKLNFNVPIPYSERNDFIHAFQKIGFKYEHIFSDGVYSLHKLTGRLPCKDRASPNIDIVFTDFLSRELFTHFYVDDVEITFMSERK